MSADAMLASVNQFDLHASLEELNALRYNPAGLPILDLWLVHESKAQEAGSDRVVQLRMKAVAFGAIAQTLARQDLKVMFHFRGFLNTSRNGKGVVFHIQELHT